MPYTEYCCRSGGSNLNSGTRSGSTTEPGVTSDFTYASGSWVAATGVFTVAAGNPSTDGVAAGDFVSVYPDGSTVGVFIARVTSVSATTITVSLTAKSGTAPVDGTLTRTVKVGGAFAGPSGANGFPVNFLQSSGSNGSGDPPRLNLKNDAVYSVTAGLSLNATSSVNFIEGYTATYGDYGRAVIDGGTTGASYILFNYNPSTLVGGHCGSLELRNNGATGTSDGLNFSGTDRSSTFFNIVAHDIRGIGINNQTGPTFECEAYNCNQSNTSGKGGMLLLQGNRCIAHHNSGNLSSGFIITIQGNLINCIADTNGLHGFNCGGQRTCTMTNCDAYNNGGSGVFGSDYPVMVNCNFVKNASYGATGGRGRMVNCGFGSGTQANTSGQTQGTGLTQVNSITYASGVTPWVAPTTGDFRVTLAAAKGAGRGTFLQTQAGYTGAVGYVDLGAAQHLDSGGGAAGTPAYAFIG